MKERDYRYYYEKMEASADRKLELLLPILSELPSDPTIISIGAGTGYVENELLSLIPSATIIPLDYQLPMIQKIAGIPPVISSLELYENRKLEPIQANAFELPFAPKSADLIIAFSVFHELASFGDSYQYGKRVLNAYREHFQLLKTGGFFAFKDFIKPEQMPTHATIEIQHGSQDDRVTPRQFIEYFAEHFEGKRQEILTERIIHLQERNLWKPGARLRLPSDLALELAIHSSWTQNMEQEVLERYTYHTAAELVTLFTKAAAEDQSSIRVRIAKTYTDPGYFDHILPNLQFVEATGVATKKLPAFTAGITVQKTE